MNRNNLARWLKLIIVGLGLALLAVYVLLVPEIGRQVVTDNPEFGPAYLPWLVFVSLTALPLAAAGVLAWLIACEIGRDNSFSRVNARYLRDIFLCALADAGYFFLGNLVLFFLSMSHPAVLLFSLLPTFIGVAVAVAAAALSHLVLNAAELREENESIV